MLSFKEIKDLIDLVSERGLCALEIEQMGFRLRIEGTRQEPSNGAGLPAAAAAAPAIPGTAPPAAVPAPAEPQENLHVITSPIVGTFYRSPSPEAEPFAEIGRRVTKGKTLCIIESMKLMNEIESDVEGEIVAVYPVNGQPVEYGEKLFALRLDV